jgi:phage host-nuclease inhibitor protein Gam
VRKQATNYCDCKRSTLEHTQCCRTTNATTHSVNWCQESKYVIPKIVRTPFANTNCALERHSFRGGQY